MSFRSKWIALSLGLGLAALSVAPLASRWQQGTTPPGEEPAAPPRGGAGIALVCYGQIDLEHGCTLLSPLQPGRVARILVSENDRVAAGTALLVLEDETARARLEEARATANAAEIQLDEVRCAPQQHRLRLAQQESACAALESKLAAARHVHAHKKDLKKDKLISAPDVAVSEELVKELEALCRVEQKKLAELRLRKPVRDVRRAEEEAAVARARLKQAERMLAECTLRAPQAGTVARLLVTPGAVLAPQPPQPAVLFFADEPRVVRAELEQEFAFRVALGQAVRIQDDAGGAAIGTGRVVRLSSWYLPRRSISLEPVRPTAGRTLECLIALDPGHAPVRIGQQVRVTGMASQER